MTLAVLEGIVMCFVLLIICVVGIANGPVGMVFFYACVNYGEAVCPEDIREQAICIDGDIGTVIDELRK